MGARTLFGRRVIYADVTEINDNNIIDVLQKALFTHLMNQADINYLYRYYKGDQPILYRKKDVRPEINNKVVENRANEIVSFKVGYLMGEPVQYVSRKDDKGIAEAVTRLNDYTLSEDKPSEDAELAEWWHICGTSYRMVLPDGEADLEEDEAPFEIYTLDPRFAFVVYSTALGNPPIMGVKYVLKDDGVLVFSCYTDDHFYEVENTWAIRRSEEQYLGIPIIEYPANKSRLGAFEIVLPLLDAINTTESNRIDGVEQFIQSLMLFHNVDISSEDYRELRDEGAIKFKDIDPQFKAEIEYLTAELNQTQTQTLVDSMYNIVLTICGMPNRNGGSSTSDTGTAVIMRDGWSAAEAVSYTPLTLPTIIRFTRRNYENISEKANVLTTMLNNPKIAPVLAFIHCGMFSDPQVAYKMSMEYVADQEAKAEKLAAQQQTKEGDEGNEPGKEKSGSQPGSGKGD